MTQLTEAGFKCVAAIPDLRHLSVYGPISTEGLVALGKARKLDSLTLSHVNFTEHDFAAIAGVPALTGLTVRTPGLVPPSAWGRLAGAKNLTRLDVSSTPMSAEVIAQIGKLSGLEELTFGNITLPDAALAPLGALKELQYLRTNDGSTVDGSVFAAWPQRPKMKVLSLGSKVSVSDDALRAITTAFPKLERLDVTAMAGSVTEVGFAHLPKLKQLSYIGITGDGLDDGSLVHLSKCDQVWRLHVGSPRATEIGAQRLASMSGLRELIWNNPPFSEAALKTYGKLRSLTTFYIGLKPSAETEQKLKAALPKVKVVR